MIDLFNGQDIWSDNNSTFPHNYSTTRDPLFTRVKTIDTRHC
jgi:hypothetical protein